MRRKNHYPPPLISKAINRLSGAHYFTKLDICEAYHRPQIAPGDEWKTVFCTHYGHYEYTVVLFSLVNAPAALQGHINNVLQEHLDQFCIAYLGNIVVYSNLLEEHREHVWLIITKLQEVGLYLKLSKCKFEMQRISFVRFIVTLEGGEMELNRVYTIAEWPEPTCYCDIQVVLGFANFYRCFMSNFVRLAKPMTDIIKGGKNGHFLGPILPTPAMKQFFAMLCNTFTNVPVLVHCNPAKPISLETDASGFAITGIISQQQAKVHGSAESAARCVK
jgi:hypothetical protein